MVIEDTLFVLFRRIAPESVIADWCKTLESHTGSTKKPLSLLPDENTFYTILQNQFPHYSYNEAEYAYKYAKEISENFSNNETGIFALIAESVKDMLITDFRNECLCSYKSLLNFRNLTHPIDPLIFTAAFLANNDIKTSFKRSVFSWPVNMHTDNERLYHILDKGMAENHFHISGSSSAFHFSWICLMNNYTPKRKNEFKNQKIDEYPMDSFYSITVPTDSNYVLTFKAVCIRLFLYLRLRDQWVINVSCDENTKDVNDMWLKEMLQSTEIECDINSLKVNDIISSLKQMCRTNESGFVADYALFDEPQPPFDDTDSNYYHGVAVRNYERHLFYHLAGEQRFLYDLFSAIYKGDKRITPYLDIAYIYLLIYCKIRSELMQINNRVGFGNFLKYQDRKEIFTDNYPEYELMRTCVAQQTVLLNPQITSFEGRLCPAKSPTDLIKKIEHLKYAASYFPNGNTKIKEHINNVVNQKLHYVLHFPKESQEYSGNDLELLSPRDNKMRNRVSEQATAIIEAKKISPEVMSIISGIDACSNEIDCRPEVFAPDFRRIRQYRYEHDGFLSKTPGRNLRITYHAGEDFLDPIDGIRAIDEALAFLEMHGGDRLGHALALGIDCEEWYSLKQHTVLLKKQALLDNLTWLYGKMHHYNIQNTAAEDEIFKWFKKLYTEIYTSSLKNPTKSIINSVDVLDYYTSLKLRGNEPSLYYHNPDGASLERENFFNSIENAEFEPWKLRTKAGKNYDLVSNALYHYYHYNKDMKVASDKRIEYEVHKSIIAAVCMVQEKMQYDISKNNIGIECNPSSNFLIGTFKDYLKHPIFKFNNKYLFSKNDKRSLIKNPRISASINTDDLGIFETSLENEYALLACALEDYNKHCNDNDVILPDNIYSWLDFIREQGCYQSFIKNQT